VIYGYYLLLQHVTVIGRGTALPPTVYFSETAPGRPEGHTGGRLQAGHFILSAISAGYMFIAVIF